MATRISHYWAFSAHPDLYRVEDALAALSEDTWTTKQSHIQAGDECVLWKAQGKDRHRGVVGFGEITSGPELLDDSKNPFWVPGKAPHGPELRVRVRYRQPHGLPLWLDEHPKSVLDELSVSRGQGTVFRVSEDQWRRLRALVDEVAGGGRARNPAWSRDELILALDLYLRHGQLDDTDAEVIELSRVLNALPIHTARPDIERFRNPNGVAMKLGNFARFDPTYSGTGLSRGNRLEAEVWDYFIDRRKELTEVVATLRAGAVSGVFPNVPEADEDEIEGVEGRLLSRRHLARERNPLLRKKKVARALQQTGSLSCEVCGFGFAEVYGDLGKGFVECHHVRALSDSGATVTRLSDLALVCSNCHRMLHRNRPWPSVAELRSTVRQHAGNGRPTGCT